VWPFATPGTQFEQTLGPEDDPCLSSMDSGQWFMRKRILNVLLYKPIYKTPCPQGRGHFLTPWTLFEHTWISLS